MPLLKWFCNAGFFYLGWLVCMQLAAGPYRLFGPLTVLLILIYHFAVTKERRPDFVLCVSLGIIGTLVDSSYVWMGMLSYQGGYASLPMAAPLWITSLWSLYAVSVNHSLSWLRLSPVLAITLGAAGAISSYLVGIKLEVVKSNWDEPLSLGVIGLVWAVVVPLSLKWGQWLQRK